MIQPAPYCPDPVRLLAAVDLHARPIAFLSDPDRPGPLNRYSILSAWPALWLSASGVDDPIRMVSPAGGAILGEFGAFDAAVRAALSMLELAPAPIECFDPRDSMPFTGGLAGGLAYEFGARFDRMPRRPPEPGCPSLGLGLYASAYVVDHLLRRAWWVSRAASSTDPTLRRRIADSLEFLRSWITGALDHPAAPAPRHTPPPPAFPEVTPDWRDGWQASLDASAYDRAVGRIQDYLRDGDIYQANLTVRYRRRLDVDPRSLFASLVRENPAPFAAFLGSPEGSVLSSSPELFLNLAVDGSIETRPIKGTIALAGAPRGEAGASAADATGQLLLRSAKDRAEHIMIVDLERNDLGRVCRIGSVHVSPLFAVEKYTGLQHLVSAVRGRLSPGLGPCDAIRALFPGGSITGAPKIRAMEIIHELEPDPRGIYTGAIGWITPEGESRMNLAIRTLIHRPGLLDLQVGGGIVFDSTPHAEYEECRLKGQAMARAVSACLATSSDPLPPGPNCFATPDTCC